MDIKSIEARVRGTGARSQPGRFDTISIGLHWLTALLVTGQLATAWLLYMGEGDPAGLLVVHRSAGVFTWVVVLVRLIWRRRYAYLPPFPASMPRLQQSAAKLNEHGLYVLLLIQPLTGICSALLRGRPFALFLWQVPDLGISNKDLSILFSRLHEFGAWGLLVLIGMHLAAALFHALVLRDGILQRMIPRLGSRSSQP